MDDLETIFIPGLHGVPSLTIHVTPWGQVYELGPVAPVATLPPSLAARLAA